MDLVKIGAQIFIWIAAFCGKGQVSDRMKELLKFEFNGESIWDDG